jgi:hypothetical protein
MSDSRSSDAPAPDERPVDDRLDSWKEIAAYLRRDVTTVQRWEKREDMPVHRHVHDKRGSVYAFRTEIDGWARGRNLTVTNEDGTNAPVRGQLDTRGATGGAERTNDAIASQSSSATEWSRRRSLVWSSTAAGALLALVAIWWFLDRRDYFWRSPIAEAAFQSVTDFAGVERRPPFLATAGSSPFCLIATDAWTSGSPKSGQDSSTTSPAVAFHNSSIHQFARWVSRQTVHW